MIEIKSMTKNDIVSVARIHSEAFIRQCASTKWVRCNFNAFPRIMMYVATDEKKQVVGYIQWVQKSGFRKESVIELEQIAVLQKFQGNKIGSELIKRSLEFVREYLARQSSTLKAVIVTTRADNFARNLYEKTLDVEVAATVKNLYSADEVFMIATYN